MSPLTLDRKAKVAHSTHEVTAGSPVGTRSASVGTGPRTRFRVITRRPLPPPYRLRRATPRNPLKRALTLAGLPAVALVAYVALWTGAMHGGYYQQRIENQIKAIQVENDTLQANLRKLQSPRRILSQAREMGMKPADAIQFIDARSPDSPRTTDPARRAALPRTIATVAPGTVSRMSSASH